MKASRRIRRHTLHLLVLVAYAYCQCAAWAPNPAGIVKVEVAVVANLIVMPGYVNDSEKLNAILDSGASTNILDPQLRSELKIPSVGSVAAAGIGKGEDETLNQFDGVNLSWGPHRILRLKEQHLATLPINYISAQTGYPIDAIFGSSLFQRFRIRVNYKRGEVIFGSALVTEDAKATVPILIDHGVPFMKATLETSSGGKVPALFLVDSGTTGPMILSRHFLDTHPELGAGHVYVDEPSVTAVGGPIDLQLLRISGIEIGPFRLASPIAAVPRTAVGALANPEIAGFIGGGVLSRFTVDWDYQDKTLGLTPNHEFDQPFEGDASGMRMVADAPGWKLIRVAAIMPDSPAAEAGFQIGDTLATLDSKPVPRLYEITKLFAEPGHVHELGVIRSGRQVKLTIHLRRLV